MIKFFWFVEYAATFAEFLMFTLFCGTFLDEPNIKDKFARKITLSLVCAGLMLFVNHLKVFSAITTLFALILVSLQEYLIYRKKPVKIIVLDVVFLVAMLLIDNSVAGTISFTQNIPISEIYAEFSLYRTLAVTVSKLLLVFLTVMINRFFSQKTALNTKYIVSLFAVSAVMALLTLTMTFSEMESQSVNSYLSVLFFAVMLVLLIIVFFGMLRLTEFYENQQQLQLTMQKNQMLEQSMSETKQTFELLRNSMHNYRHNIINLKSLAEKGDLEGIKSYIAIEEELLGKKLFYYKTGNDTVDAILYIKQNNAEKHGIPFIINAEVERDCPVSSAHFAVILGNLLDNSIEASLKESDPFIEVTIRSVDDKLWIIVLNKCTNINVSLKTLKSNKYLHGIGLKSVKHTVKQYDGELVINTVDDTFKVKIMIPLQSQPQ
ncbi:MAG: GHKL domain-containing protein [Ruminococcus sp.]|nr:GHKL domain-containing protein [Ruminococcus sp.]